MNPIARFGPCWGLTLWRWNQFKIELWYAPKDFVPPEHTHDQSDSEFWVLFTRRREIYKRKHGRKVSYVADFPSCLFKTLTVRSDEPHKFERGDACMIWVCFEHWKPGIPVTSVAQDLRITNYESSQVS